MRIFKRFLLYILSIVLVVTLVSAAFIVPWLHMPTDFHDQALRAKLAGQIDTIVIGQSYAMDGIVPSILDEKLGTRTYNLSGSLMPLLGQQYMLKKELARNPVRHVLLEITPDTLTTDENLTYGNGDSYVFARLDSMAERAEYLIRCVQPADWPNVYARILLLSLRAAANSIFGRLEMIDEANMGFRPQEVEDVSLDDDWASAQHQAMSIFGNPLEENIQRYEEIIRLCKEAGCEVTLVYTPVSHGKVWQLSDQDVFLNWAKELAGKHDLPLFDFNLLKDRYTLFSDAVSFSDDNHLSLEGAQVFSGVMADVLLRYRAGENVSPMFYDSYRRVIIDSVYWKR